MAKIRAGIRPFPYRILALLPAMVLGACQATPSLPVQQIYMQTEDSHPHEILPGETARFPFWPSQHIGFIDVKCTLSGEGVVFELRLSDIDPRGWAAANRTLPLSHEELQIDIEGDVAKAGSGTVSFAFVNNSQSRLLWHQCYNN